MAAQQYYAGPRAADVPTAAPAFSSQDEGHKLAAGLFRNDTADTGKLAVTRGDRDEHPAPAPAPSSGIDREERDEDDGCGMPTGKQPPAAAPLKAAKGHGNSNSRSSSGGAFTSGNTEQLDGNHGNSILRRSVSGTASDGSSDGQAISAVALLLLAASTTAHSSRLPVASSEAATSEGRLCSKFLPVHTFAASGSFGGSLVGIHPSASPISPASLKYTSSNPYYWSSQVWLFLQQRAGR